MNKSEKFFIKVAATISDPDFIFSEEIGNVSYFDIIDAILKTRVGALVPVKHGNDWRYGTFKGINDITIAQDTTQKIMTQFSKSMTVSEALMQLGFIGELSEEDSTYGELLSDEYGDTFKI